MIIDSHAHIIEHLSGMGARGEVRPVGDGRVRFLDGEEMQVIPREIGGAGFSAEQLLEQMELAHIDRASAAPWAAVRPSERLYLRMRCQIPG